MELQKAIDIGCNVPNIVLQGGVALFQLLLDLLYGVQDGGMILGKFHTDVRQAEIGELSDQVHGDLPGFHHIFRPLRATEYDLVHVARRIRSSSILRVKLTELG